VIQRTYIVASVPKHDSLTSNNGNTACKPNDTIASKTILRRKKGDLMSNTNTNNINTAFYDSIVLQIINNKAFSAGLIDEKTKLNIEHQIMRSVSVTPAK